MRWLGIDGGGTKTAFSIFDDRLRMLDRFTLPTCHYAQAGLEGMREVLDRGCARARACEALGDDYGIGFSICGYGEDAEADRAARAAAESIAGPHPHAIVNDVEAAWAAGLDMADGVALIAGTGSIALGVRAGRQVRCGGWDYEVGDEGGGGWMGRELLRAFTRQSDGRDPRGPLHALVRERLRLDDDFEVIARARELLPDRTRTAALSPLVTEAAEAGDASARAIFERAAREEADLVRTLVGELFSDRIADEGAVPVACIGGTFQAGAHILRPLSAALPSCCRLVRPAHEPDVGAVLILRARLARDR